MDTRLRELERDAKITGDNAPWLKALRHTESKLLVKTDCCIEVGGIFRHRTTRRLHAHCPSCNGYGERPYTWDERITLAAYCGDIGARALTEAYRVKFNGTWIHAGCSQGQIISCSATSKAAILDSCYCTLPERRYKPIKYIDNLPCPQEALEHAALAACEWWLARETERCGKKMGIFPSLALEAARNYINNPQPATREACSIGTTQDPCRLLAFYFSSRLDAADPSYAVYMRAGLRHVIITTEIPLDAIKERIIKWLLP